MIWDKIWKRKDNTTDLKDDNSCSGSYSVCEGYGNYFKDSTTGILITPIEKRKICQYEEYELYEYIKKIEQDYRDIIISLEDNPAMYRYWVTIHQLLSKEPIEIQITPIRKISISYLTNIDDALYQIRFLCDNVIHELEIQKHNFKYRLKHPVYNNQQDQETQAHYCTSCGATLKRNSHKCEYCDTEYW